MAVSPTKARVGEPTRGYLGAELRVMKGENKGRWIDPLHAFNVSRFLLRKVYIIDAPEVSDRESIRTQ